jgi:hypothetical protein
MGTGRYVQLMIALMAAALVLTACGEDGEETVSTPTAEPAPTPTLEPQDDDAVAAQPETDEVPCEVRQLEPPAEDAPEPDPERIEEWLETAMSFNDVAIGPDGDIYIGSHRHAAVLVLDDGETLEQVWTEGVRNRNRIAFHPDDRVILLQDTGIHFYEQNGEHQHYLSMFDLDAGWAPEYGGIIVDSDGHLYVGLDREEFLIKLDEDCTVLGHWPDDSTPVPPPIAIDRDDLIYALTPAPELSEMRILDQEGSEVHTWEMDQPADDALPYAIADRPEGGVAVLWNIPEDEPAVDPQMRAVADFVVQHYTPDGDLVEKWAGSESGAPELLAQPRGIAIDEDNITFIVDGGVGADRMRMHIFSGGGVFQDEWRLESDEALCDFNGEDIWFAECE